MFKGKRLWLFPILLLIALVVFAACGDDGEEATPAPDGETPPAADESPPAAGEEVTLTFSFPVWFGERYDRVLDRYIPTYEQLMADQGTPVKIEIVELPAGDDDYRAAQVTRLAAGAHTDIFLLDGFNIPADSSAGFLLDLTDRANAWDGWAQWFEAAKGGVSFGGSVWGLNREVDVRPLYYRRDVLEKAGVIGAGEDWQPTSWEEILTAARDIKANVPGVAPIAFKSGILGGESTTMQGFYPLLLGAGGRLFDTDSGKWVSRSSAFTESLEFLRTIFIDEELSTAPEFWLAGSPVDDAHVLFRDGELAMLVTWDGVWTEMADPEHSRFIPDPGRDAVAGFAMIPAKEPGASWTGEDFVTISGGWTMVINGAITPEKADLAFEFLKLVYSKDELVAYIVDGLGGGISVRQDVVADPGVVAVADAFADFREVFVDFTTFRPGLPEYPEISDAVQEATEKILLGESPEDVADFYASKVEEIVGAENTIEK
jgi:multiple sugar transport system substrate-binding protein